MKTLILYASTYGFAAKCAKTLCEKITTEVDYIDIGKKQAFDLSQYDTVIIGGSIYMGMIQKSIKEFCEENLPILLTKKIGLFICCGFSENFEIHLKNAFPPELLARAEKKECFGGEIKMEKLKFAHKMITKMISKAAQKEGKSKADPLVEAMPQNIDALADSINRIA